MHHRGVSSMNTYVCMLHVYAYLSLHMQTGCLERIETLRTAAGQL